MHRTTWRPPVKPPVGAAIIDPSGVGQGLVASSLFNEVAGRPFAPPFGPQWTLGGATVWGMSPDGVALTSTASSGSGNALSLSCAAFAARLTDGYSLAWRARYSGISGYDDGMLSLADSGGGNISVHTQFQNAATELAVWVHDGGGTQRLLDPRIIADAGDLHTYHLTASPTAGAAFYQDGRLIGTSSGWSGLFVSANALLCLFNESGDWQGIAPSGSVVWLMLWARTLPSVQVAAHAVDPQCVLRPVVRRRYSLPSSAGAYTLTAATEAFALTGPATGVKADRLIRVAPRPAVA